VSAKPAAVPDLDALFGAARDGVAIVTRDGSIRYANSSLGEIVGLIGATVQGPRLWDALPGWDRAEAVAPLRDALRERHAIRFRVGGELGRGRVWEVSAEPRDDGDLLVRLHNATAREALERAMTAGEDGSVRDPEGGGGTLFEILDAMPIGVVVAEADTGGVVYLNPAAVEIGGRPRGVLAAQSADEYAVAWQLFHPTGEPVAHDDLPLSRALRGATVRDAELVLHLPDGSERTLLASAVPLHAADGSVRRALVAFYDITQRRGLEQQLLERTVEAEHAAANASMRADESRALRDLGRTLVSSRDPAGVWRLAGESAMELLGARGSFVATPLEDGVTLCLSPALGAMSSFEGMEVPLSGTAAEAALNLGTQRLNSLDALPADSPLRDGLRRAGVRNLMLVPMRVFGEKLGVLGVVDRSGGFSDEDVRLMEAFADSAALAAYNARLLDETRRRADANRALLAAGEVMSSTLNPDEVRERIVLLAEELVDADGAALGLRAGEDGEVLWIPAASGVLDLFRGVRRLMEGTFMEGVLRGRRAVVASASEPGAHAVIRGLRAAGAEHHAAVPLHVGDDAIGVLDVARGPGRPPFSAADLRVLTLLGSQAALAERNARLYDQAQQASRAKSQFLSAMSHELRTPLNAVEGYASLLADGIYGPLNDEQRNALQRMRSARAHLTELIDEVLDIAQVEAGRRPVEHRPVVLAELVEETVEALRGTAEVRGLALSFTAGTAGEMRTDAGMVRQILMNLLGNALKFTQGGEVAVRCAVAGDGIEVEVRDTGPGVPAELQERIFEPFFRGEPFPDRVAEGVGLGLALSREFARLLGGDLVVESREGEGSAFTLRLPLGGSR
jgi:PAS domain S-box-containing protein